MQLLKLSIIVALFICARGLYAQTNDYSKPKCFDFHRFHCKKSTNVYYKLHEASRSALFVQGQTSQIPLEITNGRDYRVSFCLDSTLGSVVHFQLVDKYEGTVLYDNTKDNMAQEFEFTVIETRSLVIKVTVPGNTKLSKNGEDGKMGIIRKNNLMGCVGILVEHMITPPKGF